MRLDLQKLVGDTWKGAEVAQKANSAYIQLLLNLGHMMRLDDGRVVLTVAGCTAYQAELDAEYDAKACTSNNARLVNSLVAFKR